MIGAAIPIAIVLIIVGGVTASVVSYYRLQRHRADAVAMAAYRKLAEEAVTAQQEMHVQLVELTLRVTSLEYLLRSVG
ncbi:MAG TPA: hypothetical protein VHF06_12840 [Pseudonocardiaceae bacterium]|nr:hypothetical protein [Pseudonocardiaceae bacterium]